MYTKQRLLALLIGTALACSVGAQAPNDRGANDYAPGSSFSAAPGQVDPPARVARLANISGNVSYTPAGENDWVQAPLNRPVVTGDRLWTADGARAELQVGSSTIRLDHQSNFDFLNLNDQLAQMELTQGTMNLEVRRLHGDETYEVDTPTIAFIANRVGDYRIDVDPQGGFTTVTARRGGGEAIGEGGKRIVVEEGQSMRFNDAQLNDYQVVRTAAADDFDMYCTQRHERYARAPARNYVSEDVVGYEDLDDYGTWESAPEYGHVWYPSSVAVDWAPYHDGHWVWVDPWGWTWVDDAPWGFAPFHYGRWAYVGSRWGWVPGPVNIAPVYAPALVAFVGGGGFGVSVSLGGPIGWFALGPGDVYFPGYHCGHDYFNRVNVGNTFVNQTVVNNYYGAWSSGNVNYAQMTFANRNAPRALTAMQTTAFAAGQPVATSAVAVNRTTMANARVLPRAMVTPTRTSLVAGSARATATPPASVANRTVIAAHSPAVQPSFAQRQALLQKNAGQPLSVNQMRSLAAQQPNARGAKAGTAAGNVRVVGNRGAAAAASPVAARSNGNATTMPGSGRAARTAADAGAAAHVRSAEFAHPGNGQDRGTARGSTAQSVRGGPGSPQSVAGNARAPQNARAAEAPKSPSGGVRSSMFAHQPESTRPSNASNRGAELRQRSATAATAPANTRGGPVRGNEVRGPQQSARISSNDRMRGNASSVTRAETTTRSRGGSSVAQNPASRETSTSSSRASGSVFSQHAAPPMARAQEQRGPRRVEQQVSTQSRAAAQTARPAYTHAPEQRGAPRQTPQQSYVQQQRAAPPQQQQHTPAPPRQTPPQSYVQHSAPPQQQQRAPAPPRQMARQAPPQHGAQPRGNEKKKDNNGGG